MQAKPFISEAHVFNDAGLMFDVWPPRTGSLAADAAPKSVAKDVADDSSHHSGPRDSSGFCALRTEDHTCFADSGTVADEHKYLAGAANDTVVGSAACISNASTVSVAAAGEDFGSDMDISRGYLLALKLWEEVIATVNTEHTSTTPSRAE